MNARPFIVGALVTLSFGCNLFESVGESDPVVEGDMAVEVEDMGLDQSESGDDVGTDLVEVDFGADMRSEDVGIDMEQSEGTWMAVSAGSRHTCALTSRGQAYCWGDGSNGRTGLGDEITVAIPTPVDTDERFTHIEAGDAHTCALNEEDLLFCWGDNDYIGLPIGRDVLVPTQVESTPFLDVSAGARHICAVTSEKKVQCAGDNGSSELGVAGVQSSPVLIDVQVPDSTRVWAGDGLTCTLTEAGEAYCWGRSFRSRENDEMQEFVDAPKLIEAGVTFERLAVGEQSACGLSTTDGEIYCWGASHFLKEDRADFENPATIDSAFRFVDISLGHDYGCAIAQNEVSFCWGSNYRARMGVGGHDSSPSEVTGFTPMNTNESFVQISAGARHGCAIDVDGELHCWGRQLWGKTGHGETGYRPEPVQVMTGETFGWVSAGEYHTCGVTTSGGVYCWGRGSYGAIGLPGREEQPLPVDIGYFTTAKMVESVVGRNCVIGANGEADCWGDDGYGTLGNGREVGDVDTPGPVLGNLAFQTISMNVYSTCGLTVGGKIACWGREDYNGIPTQESEPFLMTGHPDYIDVTTGYRHGCGIDTGGNIHCWGENGQGQLGTGNRTDSFNTPLAADSSILFTQIEASNDNTCAISENEGLYCWGDDQGDGHPTGGDRLAPERVRADLNFQLVDGNRHHFCAVSDGAVYCWGDNEYGEVGSDQLGRSASPLEVSLPGLARSVSAGSDHSCAVMEDGSVYCWGFGEFGRLGHDVLGYIDEPTPVDTSQVVPAF